MTTVQTGMQFRSIDCGNLPAQANISSFMGGSGVDEYELMIRPTRYGSIEEQLDWVLRAYRMALTEMSIDTHTAVFRRFFCSDLSNQIGALEAEPVANPRNVNDPCAVSWVRQAPMPPVKVALWAYHIHDPAGLQKTQEGTTLELKRGLLSHHWTTQMVSLSSDTSYDQTVGIFSDYLAYLRAHDMTLADNLIRTWFFVQNVDLNYGGLVKARREIFTEHGLTADTHYVSSTGIEGAHRDVAARVLMDAYAVSKVRNEQISFLTALDNLSPTHIYGVTFERGTAVSYRDRKHAFISGTASIDRDGKIVHPGDVSRQLDRTLENMQALLEDAGGGLRDVASFLVYLRDPSDHETTWKRMRALFGETPLEVLVAPVCRPGWLIEIEGRAIISHSDPDLPDF